MQKTTRHIGIASRVSLRIYSSMAVFGVLIIAVNGGLSFIHTGISQQMIWIICVVCGIAIAGITIMRFMDRIMLQPLLEIEQSLKEIGRGNHIVIDLVGHEGGLGSVARSINHISEQLQSGKAQLAKAHEQVNDQREELEAQNQEILAQQEDQLATMEKLIQGEYELSMIANFQEKLTGSYDALESFLAQSVSSLLQVIGQEAALLFFKRSDTEYDVLYACGYPDPFIPNVQTSLYGPARRVFAEKQMITVTRELSSKERGLHGAYEQATDQYFPLYDEQQNVYACLLLTAYRISNVDSQSRLIKGLMKQFELAFIAQMAHAKQREQAMKLTELNDQLLQEKLLIQEQREITENILQASHEGIIMCDYRGHVIFANQRMAEIYGADHLIGELVFKLCERFETGHDQSLSSKVEDFFQQQNNNLYERFSYIDAHREKQSYELYANAVKAEEQKERRGYLFVFRNRTEEEKMDEMKNEFVGIVSHELRTPLSSVLGFIEILLHRELPKEKQQKYMLTVYDEAKRLSTLIDDFLDLQRIESGKQEYYFTATKMDMLVRELVDLWQGKQGHNIHIAADKDDLMVHVDVDRIKQVLHNLISNAIKYSPGKHDLNVTVRAGQGKVFVDVRDYGLGIPEDARDKLFSKFYRVDNSDHRQIGGTGLGLAIAKEIAEFHQGCLTFESQLGQGSTFTLELPQYVEEQIEIG